MKAIESHQKLRGGYYTPKPIAKFLTDWAIQSATTRVLEPSCGDGNILEAAMDRLQYLGTHSESIGQLLYGVEWDACEAQKAISRFQTITGQQNGQIHIGDFFEFCREQLVQGTCFHTVVGNPPFIRYQNFQETQRSEAFRIMQLAGMRPTRLTNAWVPFLVASTLLLDKNGGRIAMVVPAEIMQVGYTAELRKFLTDGYSKITLITFKKLIFEGIQQEVVLLLGERNGAERTGIRIIEMEDANCLLGYEYTNFLETELKPVAHSSDKWTQYFLDLDEISLLRQLLQDKRLTPARKIMDVDVGIVTGQNDFFVLNCQQVEKHQLAAYTQPIVTRSAHVSGIQFSWDDYQNNIQQQLPAYLLVPPRLSHSGLPEALQHYVAYGEAQNWHTGYKCRIRTPWYVPPSIWTPDAFLLRQIHGYPKLIVNQTDATCTDTIHRVRFKPSLFKPDTIAAVFLNSFTFLCAEVMGRSYGGGVLELEPSEAESLLLPLLNAEKLDWAKTQCLMAENKIEEVLAIHDQVLLQDGLNLSEKEVKLLRQAWCKLKNRRIGRKHSKS